MGKFSYKKIKFDLNKNNIKKYLQVQKKFVK